MKGKPRTGDIRDEDTVAQTMKEIDILFLELAGKTHTLRKSR